MIRNVKWKSTCVSYTLIVTLMLLGIQGACGQVISVDSAFATFRGTVVSASTKEPVEALIQYESIPYGSLVGVMRGSSVSFPMNSRTDYMLTVTAEGYNRYISTLKNSEIRNKVLSRTIELVPNMISDVIRLDKVIFEQGKSDLTPDSFDELDKLAEMLHSNPAMEIQLEGHTDFRGDERKNMKLSERRVKAVKDYLENKGIAGKRIQTKAFGGTQPLSRNSDDDSRRRNRRVEVRILAN
ncbi:OmpA family protein [Fulvivirga sedimenti]|uniref:OmpA family protein n=1 Tax=Fulvivirga sedimenti TaxID=2879465 RepID=A0A9X1L169_9BACT|nr:OmpA family protein [Fulvivirga sedimenti]MCA6078634.1 OmpA family protein [Fulvivirga sedimenti]